MSPRRNWDSPDPSLASECAPPPRPGGGGAHSPAGEGLGKSQFRRLEKKLSTLLTLWTLPFNCENKDRFSLCMDPKQWEEKSFSFLQCDYIGFQRYVFSSNAIVWRIQCNLNLSQPPPSTPHPLLPLPKNLPCPSDRGIDQSGSLRSESTSHLPSNHMYTRTFFIKIFHNKI
jgi:hypothetical protein